MAKEENGKKKLEKAIQAGRERDYKKAALILTELISASDAPPEAYLFLGRSLHALKDYARALASFNDYVRLKPRSVPGYLFAGRTYLALGMPHKAVPIFRKALELSGRDTAIMALLGTAYLKSKHSQAASDILQQAVEIAAADGLPQLTQKRLYHAYINALFIRGIRLCRSEDYNLGRQMLAFVLENGGDGPLLRLELGRACRELGQNEEALDHYTKALMYAPDDLRIRWYRASVLMTLGDTERARREIEFIRAASAGSRENIPANLPWNSALVDFFMIRAFLDSGEWRRAADACRDWIKEAAPDERDKSPAREAMIHAMYAEALRNLKNYDAALNHLNRALKIDPNQVQLWYEKILVAWEGENWTELRKGLKSVKNLGSDQDLIRRF
ncbi:MAG: tetratricopeptide repeat protein, partial [Treponema sp.]|nr:tetratricopeptide repeat protein [Treponema sp.]